VGILNLPCQSTDHVCLPKFVYNFSVTSLTVLQCDSSMAGYFFSPLFSSYAVNCQTCGNTNINFNNVFLEIMVV
jgi:hypothetical protein